jgi:hypothetical protein
VVAKKTKQMEIFLRRCSMSMVDQEYNWIGPDELLNISSARPLYHLQINIYHIQIDVVQEKMNRSVDERKYHYICFVAIQLRRREHERLSTPLIDGNGSRTQRRDEWT